MGVRSQDQGSSPPRGGGEVARAEPETVRGADAPGRRSPQSIARARSLRRGDNMAEAVLWDELKGRKLGGHKFARQVPIGPYFADFCCRERRLVVELDGSQHAESDYDRRRDDFMCERGFSVLRMWSADVSRDLRGVGETILAAVEGRLETVTTSELRFVKARRETGKVR